MGEAHIDLCFNSLSPEPISCVHSSEKSFCFSVTSTWIFRRVVWTLDCIHIARKGEDNIIDSIPLAEADLIVVSDDGNLGNQYKRNPDSLASMKSNKLLDRQGSMQSIRNKINKTLERQNSQNLSSVEQPSDVQSSAFTSGIRMMQSTKFFNATSVKTLTGKSEIFQQEEKSSVLQISTVAEGFNSGACDLQLPRFDHIMF
jgi:hypothetical protein